MSAFATSYIPTTTASTVRSADVATMTGANFSSWYNQTEGSFLANATVTATTTDATARVVFSAGDSGTFNESLYMVRADSSASITANIVDGGAGQWVGTIGSASVGVPFIAAMAYKLNDGASAFNGVAGATDATMTLPTANSLGIGKPSWSSSNFLCGHIRRIYYWPVRLGNTTLQAISNI